MAEEDPREDFADIDLEHHDVVDDSICPGFKNCKDRKYDSTKEDCTACKTDVEQAIEQTTKGRDIIEAATEKMKISVTPGDAVIFDDKDNMIAKYISPDPQCVCCNIPNISLNINKAYLDGLSYTDIVQKFADDVFKAVGKKLDAKILSNHFTKHFNTSGVAVAEYNRKYGMSGLPSVQQQGMRDIFSTLVSDRVHDLEVLDLAMKEQVKRLKELEDIKTERIKEKRTYNLDGLIMKQEMIMNNLQTQILAKLKIWQKAQFQSKQMEVMDRQLQFLDHKTALFLGIEGGTLALEPMLAKEAEKVYLKIVIENMLKRIKHSLETAFTLSAQDKAQFLKELNRQFKGIEKDINMQFEQQLKNMKNVGK